MSPGGIEVGGESVGLPPFPHVKMKKIITDGNQVRDNCATDGFFSLSESDRKAFFFAIHSRLKICSFSVSLAQYSYFWPVP